MRGVLLALALVVAAAPVARADDTGTITVVSDGPGHATLTLPHAASLTSATVATRGTYAVLVAARSGTPSGEAVLLPGSDEPYSYGALPAGRSTLRVLADAPVTFTLRMSGMRGRRVIRLSGGVPGATAVVRPVAGTPAGIEDDIAFVAPAAAWAMHGYDRPFTLAVASSERMCVRPAEQECDATANESATGMMSNTGNAHGYSALWFRGRGHAYLKSTDVGVGGGDGTHFLFVVPTT